MFENYITLENKTLWLSMLNKASNIVLVGHAHPDGDALGSTLALTHYLKIKGKMATVLVPDRFPSFLAWMPGIDDVLIFQEHPTRTKALLEEADLMIFLDFSSPGRTVELEELLLEQTTPRIIIDHHLDPKLSADLLISFPHASSTCEVVFSLLACLGEVECINYECAQCLYCGMMTDTGGFTFQSTRPEIYHIISQLLAKGIDKDIIYRKVFHNYSVNRMRLLGYLLNEKMVYMDEYHAAFYSLTREEMEKFEFKKGDAEGIVNMPLEIKGTKLSIALREDTEKPEIRVSLRSVDDFPCNQMSNDFFNGGGHKNAAGGVLYCSMQEAIEHTKKAIESYSNLLKD